MSSGMVRTSNLVVEAQLCGFSLSACSRDKYSPVVEVQLCGFSQSACSRDKYSLRWHSMA